MGKRPPGTTSKYGFVFLYTRRIQYYIFFKLFTRYGGIYDDEQEHFRRVG